MSRTFRTQYFLNSPAGGHVLSIEDPTASLDVWILPTKIAVMRWPRGGLVRAWTIADLTADSRSPPPQQSGDLARTGSPSFSDGGRS